jgi:hypothetical protein
MATDRVNPQSVGYLNPSVDPVSNNNYENSRLSDRDAPRSQQFSEGQANAARGLGSLFNQVVETGDLYNKGQIEHGITDFVEAKNKQFLNDNYPEGLKASLREADAAGTARSQGVRTETQYWIEMEKKSREMKARFPDYEEDVDAEMSRRTGRVPANKLRDDRMQQMAEGDPVQKLLNSNLQYLSKETRESIKQGHYPTLSELQVEISQNRAPVEQAQADAALLNAEKGDWEKTQRIARTSLATSYQAVFNKEVAPSVRKLNAQVQGLTAQGIKADPTKMVEVGAAIAAEKQRVISLMRSVELGIDGQFNVSYPTYLDETQIAQVRKPYLDILDDMEKAIVGGNFDFLKMHSSMLEATVSKEAINAMETTEAFKRVAGLAKAGIPPQVVDSAMFNAATKGDTRGLEAAKAGRQAIADYIWTATVMPSNNGNKAEATPEDLTNSFKRFADTGNLDGTTATITMNKMTSVFTHKDVPLDVKARAANRIYSDPEGFLKVFNGKDMDPNGPKVPDRYKAWNILNTPDMHKTMQEVRQIDPQAYEKYQQYIAGGTRVLASVTIADLKEIVMDKRNGFKVSYDPASNRFVPDMSGVGPGDAQVLGKMWATKVEQFNAAIKPMMDMFVAEGGEDEKILPALQSMGFDPFAPKTTVGLGGTLYDWVTDTFKSKLGGPDATGAGKDAKDFAGFQISALMGTMDELEEINFALDQKPGDPTLLKERERLIKTLREVQGQPGGNEPAPVKRKPKAGEPMMAGADGGGGDNVIQFPDRGKVARDLGVPDSWLRDQKEILKEGPKINDRLTVREAYSKALNYTGYKDPADVKPLSAKAAMAVATDFKIDLKGMDVMSKQVREGLGHLQNQAAAVAKNPGSEPARRALAQNIHTVQSMIDHAAAIRDITNKNTSVRMEMREGKPLSGPTGVVNTEKAIGAGMLGGKKNPLDDDPELLR